MIETRTLPCVLNDEDKIRLANEIGTLQEQLQPIEEEVLRLKEELKDQKKEANGLKLQQYRIHRMLADGFEEREVGCDVQLNTPTVGAKRIVRTDTGVIIEEMPMTDDELQGNLEFQEPKNVHELTPSGPLTIEENPVGTE